VSPNVPTRDDTRARILRVALELFVEQGFAATSTRELSERLGFTKAALYYHFRTKEDLLAALVAPVLDELARLVGGATTQPSAAARRAVLAGYIDLVAANAGLIRMLSQDPSVARCSALTSNQALYDRLTELLSGHHAPGTAERTRVRAALGGVRAALFCTDPADDPTVVRATALAAACGALGIPDPAIPTRPR
jgi:Transcriptional regulator